MPFDAAQTVETPLQREARVRAKTGGSQERFERACRFLAGGVSTSLRRNARPYPLYFEAGLGSRVVDVDGNRYLDYGLAWGPLILGHSPQSWSRLSPAHAARIHVRRPARPRTGGVRALCEIIPCAEQVCFASSGTEIVQLALRLARAATGRRTILKFEGTITDGPTGSWLATIRRRRRLLPPAEADRCRTGAAATRPPRDRAVE